MLGTILGFSIKEFLIPWSKETHTRPISGNNRSKFIQVWHLQNLDGQGTRHWFSRKVSPGSEETRLFYKKRLQLRGAGNVSPFGSHIPAARATHMLEQTWWCLG